MLWNLHREHSGYAVSAFVRYPLGGQQCLPLPCVTVGPKPTEGMLERVCNFDQTLGHFGEQPSEMATMTPSMAVHNLFREAL